MQPLKFLSEMLEILSEDITQTRVTDRKYGGQFNFASANKRTSGELGRGLFSKVSHDATDPHMVQKQTKIPLGPEHDNKADGFDAFIRVLVENDLMDNIHFPKVYNADTNTDATGTRRHKYQIEKLVELTSLSPEEFEALVETHLLRPVRNDVQFADRISGACNSKYDRDTYIKMDSLKEACEILEELDDISDFRTDIHEGNIMARRTPHGLQLVISDPWGKVKHTERHKYSSQPKRDGGPSGDVTPEQARAMMQ